MLIITLALMAWNAPIEEGNRDWATSGLTIEVVAQPWGEAVTFLDGAGGGGLYLRNAAGGSDITFEVKTWSGSTLLETLTLLVPDGHEAWSEPGDLDDDADAISIRDLSGGPPLTLAACISGC